MGAGKSSTLWITNRSSRPLTYVAPNAITDSYAESYGTLQTEDGGHFVLDTGERLDVGSIPTTDVWPAFNRLLGYVGLGFVRHGHTIKVYDVIPLQVTNYTLASYELLLTPTNTTDKNTLRYTIGPRITRRISIPRGLHCEYANCYLLTHSSYINISTANSELTSFRAGISVERRDNIILIQRS